MSSNAQRLAQTSSRCSFSPLLSPPRGIISDSSTLKSLSLSDCSLLRPNSTSPPRELISPNLSPLSLRALSLDFHIPLLLERSHKEFRISSSVDYDTGRRRGEEGRGGKKSGKKRKFYQGVYLLTTMIRFVSKFLGKFH